jgi:hypothetical protein
MPRYFFNTYGARENPDEDGEILPDDEVAWKEATIIAGEIFKDMDGKLRPGQEWKLEVLSEDRKPLYMIQINSKKE